MIDHNNKFLFVRVPKTGSTSIIGALDLEYTYYHDIDICNIWSGDKNHYPLYIIKELIDESIYNNYYKFAFVRNPWSKVVSQYFYTLKWWRRFPEPRTIFKENYTIIKNKLLNGPLKSFETYVHSVNEWKEWHFPTPYLKCSDYKMTLGCDYIGKFENFQDDFNTICNHIGIHPRRLIKKHNKTNHKPYTNYYNKTTKKIISKVYEEDIQHFKYVYGV